MHSRFHNASAAMLIGLFSASLISAADAPPAVEFKDLSAELGLTLGGAACWADLNQDGWTDLCAGGTIWKNEGGNGFSKLAEGVGEV
ncbi:MAG: hypothetical protein ACKVT0_01770, partial [Planctomycetaceae bacterium]